MAKDKRAAKLKAVPTEGVEAKLEPLEWAEWRRVQAEKLAGQLSMALARRELQDLIAKAPGVLEARQRVVAIERELAEVIAEEQSQLEAISERVGAAVGSFKIDPGSGRVLSQHDDE